MKETKPLIKINTSHLITLPLRWVKHHGLDKRKDKGRGKGAKVSIEVSDDFIIIRPLKKDEKS